MSSSMKVYKQVLLVVMFITMSAYNVIVANAENFEGFDKPVNAKFNKIALQTALQKLSDDAGIQIIFDKDISQNVVSGYFKDVPFVDVVNRLLAGINHSLEMDMANRSLLIKAFGQANYVATSPGGADENITDIGIPLSELKALHEKQSEQFAQQLQNENEYFTDVGMTRGQLKDLHEEQTVQFEQDEKTPEFYFPLLKRTRSQLQAMHEAQQANYERSLNDEKAIMSELGVTRGEHRATLFAQASAFEESLKNDAAVLPEIGITRGEHRQMLVQQMKKFKESLTR